MIIKIVACFVLNWTQCQAIERSVMVNEPMRACVYAGGVPSFEDNHQRRIAGIHCDDGARDVIAWGWSPSDLSGFGVVSLP